jgi:hypothetical protein
MSKANRHRAPATPEEYADELDRKLDEILRPVQDQVRELLAFLDYLTRQTNGQRDYRGEFLLFWAGRNVERRQEADHAIPQPRPTLHQEYRGDDHE